MKEKNLFDRIIYKNITYTANNATCVDFVWTSPVFYAMFPIKRKDL
jgi:hypothetical protein